VVLGVALRGMVSGRLLARRWPRNYMTQIGVRRSGYLIVASGPAGNCVQEPILTMNPALVSSESSQA
jgi:hypothetical protein